MKKILKVMFIYCMSFIFFSMPSVFACNYKSSDNRVRISLKPYTVPFRHVMVSLSIDGQNKILDTASGNIILESSLISQLENGQCPTIYYSCPGSTCRIYTRSVTGTEIVEPVVVENQLEDLYCTYVSSENTKFVINKENGNAKIIGIDNFPSVSIQNSYLFEEFNGFSMIMTENKCDSELYYTLTNNAPVLYLDNASNRTKVTLTQNDIFTSCSYTSVDLKDYSEENKNNAFTIKYNLLSEKIQGDIVGFGFFKNKRIIKPIQRLKDNTCDPVVYYNCSDSSCNIYSTSVASSSSPAVLSDLLKGCDYALSDDTTAGFELYYYDKYAYVIPTMSWSSGTTFNSIDIGESLNSCPDNMYYRCNELRYGRECTVTISNEDYQSDDSNKETKKADLIGQRDGPNEGVGVAYEPQDAQTTNAEVTICNYTMQGEFDEKSGFRIRFIKDIDELEIWPIGIKAKDALFTGGGYKIINQLPPSEVKSGNCLEQFYYKIQESVGNKYKFTLSDSNNGNGWNLATLDS